MLDQIVAALTAPLTEEEMCPAPVEDFSHKSFTGTLDELNDLFYAHGWTNGTPITPPTEEAVAEMCRGTVLPQGTMWWPPCRP